MSVDLIKKYYGFASRNDFAAALELYAEDAEIVFVGPPSIPLAGMYRGRAGIERFYATIGRALNVEIFEPLEFIDGGDQVVVIGRERSVVRATNKTFDISWVQVWTVAGGRIKRLRDFFDTGTMAIACAQ